MKWHYEDAAGTWHEGTVEHISDLGGTDITYRMRDAIGRVSMVSGSRLKAAHAVYGPVAECPVCDAP